MYSNKTTGEKKLKWSLAGRSRAKMAALGDQPTVDGLDASAVVVGELEVFSVKPLIEGGHDGRGAVGVLQTQSMTQLMDGYQENIISFNDRKRTFRFIHFDNCKENKLDAPLFLTSLVDGPSGPGLREVKVRVSPDAVSGEVSVRQEAALAIKRCAVAMETLREGEHDVCELVDLVPDVAVGDLSEGERDRALPHFEGLPDGFISGLFANFRGVVLYTVVKNRHVSVSKYQYLGASIRQIQFY